MGKIIYGALGTEIRGSIGGSTFQRNKHGFTMRNKPKMTLPSGNAVRLIQQNMVQVIQAWQALTPAERLDYVTYASTYPQYSKNNPTSVLSGYEVYLMWQATRLAVEQNIRSGIVFHSIAFPTFAPTVTRTGSHLYVNLHDVGGDTNCFFGVYMSGTVLNSINFIGSRTRYITIAVIGEGSSDWAGMYISRLGALPESGSTIFMRIIPLGADAPVVRAEQKFKIKVS